MRGNPYGKYNGTELRYVTSFLEEGGDFVSRLELAFSKKLDQQYAIAVNSGTSALHAALVACNVKGGEVLMSALCPAMVAFAVIHAGATPVFCDVDSDTHHISNDEIAKKITNKTKAILAVSLHGLPFNWDFVLEHKRHYFMIDDCAQALGAKGIGKADITCFSFEDKKHITSGSEGGMITTNNPELAMRARKFAGLGYKHMTADAGRTSLAQSTYQDPSYERFDTIGLNYRMSQIQAAVGLGQLERLDHIVARRRSVAAMFLGHEGNPNHSYYTLAIQNNVDWKKTYDKFVNMGGYGFYAMPQLPYNEPALLAAHFKYIGCCPIAEDLQKKLMLMKTNYRNLGEARNQATIYHKMISEWF